MFDDIQAPAFRRHETALLDYQPMPSPALGRPVQSQPYTEIGAGVCIGAYAVVYGGSSIGADSLVGEHAVIREGVRIGRRCLIGQGVFVNYDAEIGDDVRIIQGAHIAGLCRIGAGTFIGPGVMMSNMRQIDIDHQVFDYAQARAPIIGERVMIGAGAVLLAGITIGDRATIGSGSVVTRDVAAGETVFGNPARPYRKAVHAA